LSKDYQGKLEDALYDVIRCASYDGGMSNAEESIHEFIKLLLKAVKEIR